MDEKYTELAVKLQEIDSRSRSNESRINTLQDGFHKIQDTQITLVKIATSVENMGECIASIREDLHELKVSQAELNAKVTDLENRPAKESKKWVDTVTANLLWLFLGGVAAWLLSQMLPVIPW